MIKVCAAGVSPAAQIPCKGMDKISLQRVLPAVFAETPPADSDIWLKEVTLEKGTVYLVEAASGSGKSSFCSYLYGYRRDYSGRILFDDQDIRSLSMTQWSRLRRNSLSMLFQELRLFPELSALDNVRLKNKLTGYRSEAQIASFFEALGIADKAETPVAKLSFGQQQRVAFIRMLCQPADFMSLDEPMSHLDDRNAATMARILLDEARKSGAGVVVTSIGKRFDIAYDKIFAL